MVSWSVMVTKSIPRASEPVDVMGRGGALGQAEGALDAELAVREAEEWQCRSTRLIGLDVIALP